MRGWSTSRKKNRQPKSKRFAEAGSLGGFPLLNDWKRQMFLIILIGLANDMTQTTKIRRSSTVNIFLKKEKEKLKLDYLTK